MLDKRPVIPGILRQHVEGAAFLWTQRARMFHDPAMDAIQLGRNDLRLGAHLSAALASGAESLAEAERRYDDFADAGEIFAWLALSLLGESDKLDACIDRIAEAETVEARGASGAVAWVGLGPLKPHVDAWSRAKDPFRRWLAFMAFSHYRVDPGDRLDHALKDRFPPLRARALRLIGELGDTARLPDALAALDAPEQAGQRFCAARSALLLGDTTKSLPVLRKIAETDGLYADAALELAVLGDKTPELRKWLGGLIRDEDRREAALSVSGAIDDSTVLDWLLSKCADPTYAAGVTQALRSALPFDLDDTTALEADVEEMGPGFEDRDDGPWAVSARVKEAIAEHSEAGRPDFINLPTTRRRILSAALTKPGNVLGEWRGRRAYPAWS